jgi:DNA-binding transcriptional MocR family regulator
VELPGAVKTVDLYEKAISRKISFAPGRIFTLQDQYQNCLRLNYGLIWNDRLEAHLKLLGTMAKAEMAS